MSRSPERPGDRDEDGQVSEGGSSFANPETATGGADGVPDTPDVNTSQGGGGPEPSVPDAASDSDMTKGDDARPDS